LGRTEKLVGKVKRNPKNVRFEELCNVLKYCGYDIINVRGSHYSFSNGKKTLTIVKPHGGNKFCHVMDVKEVVKRCLQ
jgi:predicted RNA binding protein YcfA (HicA-like mRNA interferase family)